MVPPDTMLCEAHSILFEVPQPKYYVPKSIQASRADFHLWKLWKTEELNDTKRKQTDKSKM